MRADRNVRPTLSSGFLRMIVWASVKKTWERETGRKEKVVHEKPVVRVPRRRQVEIYRGI